VISFVPEFANHVLNDKNLYKKGYDASGEFDEELTKEAELSINPMQIIFDSCEKINKLFLLYLIVTDFYDFTLTGLLL
jgi:H/ACA ribonucleoprotein complex non-core subunit NAF1